MAWWPKGGSSLLFLPPPAECHPVPSLPCSWTPHLGVQSLSSAGDIWELRLPCSHLQEPLPPYPHTRLLSQGLLFSVPFGHMYPSLRIYMLCLSFSENITCVGFLPPPVLCSLWPGERRRDNNVSSRVLQLKLIRNSGFPAGKPPLC